MVDERKVNRAVQAATRAVHDIMGQQWDRKRLKIDKFGRHRDGYLHARVLVDGDRVAYFHRRYGSWLAPGNEGMLKEPEALLGGALGRSLKYQLSEASEPWDTRERRERERQLEEAKRAKQRERDTRETSEPEGDHPPADAAGVPEARDQDGADEAVRADEPAGV